MRLTAQFLHHNFVKCVQCTSYCCSTRKLTFHLYSLDLTLTLTAMGVVFSAIQPHLRHVPLHFSTAECLFVAFALVYLSKVLHVSLSYVLAGKYDMVQAGYRSGDSGAVVTHKAVSRAYNAHCNAIEAFVGFSVAVLLALQLKGDSEELRVLANAFVYVRLVYNGVYIIASNSALAVVRSAVFTVGMVFVLKIFSLAVGGVAATIF